MKIGKLILKKEYVLYYLKPETPIWFYDEPVGNKKNLIERIKMLKKEKAKTSVSTRFTIEI
jgi:hypothetical protein